MPCTTIIIRHFAPSVSIIADDVESVLSHCATTTVRCSKKSIAISGEARLISTLPPMRTSRVSASRAEPADRALRSQTIPIAARPRIASRAFVQSGFNEVAS